VEGCEGWRRKYPVFHLKAGFFISGLMKNIPACGGQASAALFLFRILDFGIRNFQSAIQNLQSEIHRVRLIPQDFACLRVAASAKAGAPCIWTFLLSPKRFFQ
jgi:hypothetical protein